MLAILSPAKTLDFATDQTIQQFSRPEFLKEASQLMAILRDLAPAEIASLMGVSDKIAALNYQRFGSWQLPFSLENAKQAVLAFKGDVYQGLAAWSLQTKDLSWAQDHLRILSGLYGLLRPLDLIQPYRLEMGTSLANPGGANLYDFWGARLTQSLNKCLANHRPRVLVNLASQEYVNAIQLDDIDGRIITPQFLDWKNGEYKFISFHAKKARGLMARYIIENRINAVKALQQFDLDGYCYCPDRSSGDTWIFLRRS